VTFGDAPDPLFATVVEVGEGFSARMMTYVVVIVVNGWFFFNNGRHRVSVFSTSNNFPFFVSSKSVAVAIAFLHFARSFRVKLIKVPVDGGWPFALNNLPLLPIFSALYLCPLLVRQKTVTVGVDSLGDDVSESGPETAVRSRA
jgi:hypothetical protein